MQRILTYSYRDDSLVTTLSLWCTSGIPSVRNTRWTLFFLFIAEVRDGRHLFLIDRQSGGHRHLSNGSNYKSNILYLCVCFKSLYLNYPSRIVPLWRCRLFFSLRETPRSFFPRFVYLTLWIILFILNLKISMITIFFCVFVRWLYFIFYNWMSRLSSVQSTNSQNDDDDDDVVDPPHTQHMSADDKYGTFRVSPGPIIFVHDRHTQIHVWMIIVTRRKSFW